MNNDFKWLMVFFSVGILAICLCAFAPNSNEKCKITVMQKNYTVEQIKEVCK